jgi:hypothetical protein
MIYSQIIHQISLLSFQKTYFLNFILFFENLNIFENNIISVSKPARGLQEDWVKVFSLQHVV